jgi:hypothetical protein
VAVAHLTLDLGLRYKGGDRVNDDDVEGAGPNEHVRDLQRLFPRVRLRDQQGVGIDTELLGVLRVEGMLGVDEGRDPA